MAEKKIVIAGKMTVDSTAFSNAVKQMKEQLSQLYTGAAAAQAENQLSRRLQSMGHGSLPGGASAAQVYQERKRADDERNKSLDQHIKQYADLKKQMTDTAKTQEELNSLKVKEVELKSKMNDLLREERNLKQLGQDAISAVSGGGLSGLKAFAGGLSRSEMFKLGGSALGLAGAGMQAGGALYRDYTRAPVESTIAQGSATRGMAGRELENVYSGRTAFENIFAPERQRALSKAYEAYRGGRAADILGVGGTAVSAIGAGIGAFAGGPVGAGVVGGGLAAGAGLYNMITNQRSRDAALSMFGGRYSERYEATRAEQFARDFRSTQEAEKEKNPLKKLAAEEFEKNMMRNLAAQRSMGLTGNQFYGEGGFQSRVQQAGFTGEMGIGMSQSILGAGGSTGMSRQAQFGLQMQRAGLTNASNILGSLSGSIQSPESTKQATISIMSEAFKIGLDNTSFAEENRKFSQAAADVLGRSGATTEADQTRIIQSLSQFLGERTGAGVQAAQGAYEAFQQRGSALSGRRGVLRMTEGMKSPILSKFTAEDRAELLGARPEDLREDSAFLKAYANQAGVTPKALIDELSKVNTATRFLVPGHAKAAEKQASIVEKFMREKGIDYSRFTEMSRRGELPKEVETAYGMYQRKLSEENVGGAKPIELEAAAGERFAGISARSEEKPMGKSIKDSIKDMLGVGPRTEDKFVSAAAKDAEVVRDNFNKMSSEMGRAAEEADKMTEAARKMALVLSEALKENDAKKQGNMVADFLKSMMATTPTQTQTQTNKPAK